jgi:nitrogen fixation protein NifU and related proteins
MSDLRELYQEVILAHNKSPRNFRSLPEADRTAVGHNPLCGDQLTLFLKLNGDLIEDATFQGKGCAISKASASLMTESVKGKTRQEAQELFGRFHELLTGPPDVKRDAKELGKLAVFSGVREFPVRVKCATLAWQTLRAALEQEGTITSTE